MIDNNKYVEKEIKLKTVPIQMGILSSDVIYCNLKYMDENGNCVEEQQVPIGSLDSDYCITRHLAIPGFLYCESYSMDSMELYYNNKLLGNQKDKFSYLGTSISSHELRNLYIFFSTTV